MPAAGIAGFIKACLSVHYGIKPPAVGCVDPNPLVKETRFQLNPTVISWATPERVAGINAFGFGGINAHVVITNEDERAAIDESSQHRDAPVVATWCANSPDELLAALNGEPTDRTLPSERFRVVIHSPSAKKVERAKKFVAKGTRCMGRFGLWYEPEPEREVTNSVVFLFPGIEASFKPKVDELLEASGMPQLPADASENLEKQGFNVIALGRSLHQILISEGIHPTAYAGHSVGEWAAMLASGMIDKDAGDAFIASLKPGTLEVPGVAFLAAGCRMEKAQSVIDDWEDISISHDNCPHQVILCGRDDQIQRAQETLTAERVLCQVLPFRSGFHSPLFENFVAPHRAHFQGLPLGTPDHPVWSATTAEPFPLNPELIRELAIRHLTERVSFRPLIEALYAAGKRIFIQCGVGSVTSFVADTLRGRPHVAVSAADEVVSGHEQLLKLKAALFVSGVDIDPHHAVSTQEHQHRGRLRLHLGVPLVRLQTPIKTERVGQTELDLPYDDPVFQAYRDVIQTVVETTRRVATTYASATSDHVQQRTTSHRLSVDAQPFLLDHCFFRQPPNWRNVSDRFPVVPLTMLIEMMTEAAKNLAPEQSIIYLEHLRAYKWLAVEPPVEVKIKAARLDPERVKVQIEGYCECVVGLGYQRITERAPTTSASASTLLEGSELYGDRWMFHGPEYQGVRRVTDMDEACIVGELEALPAPGALLDCAGQLLGYWVMKNTTIDRLAMPILIERLDWYENPLRNNQRVECRVHIKRLTDRQVRADMELFADGQTLFRIKGWTDQRFDTNALSWPIIRYPEKNLFSVFEQPAYALLDSPFETAASQDYFHRRYLNESERRAYQSLYPNQRYSWLAGRITAKDAVRKLLCGPGDDYLFPVEIEIRNDERGAPIVIGQGCHQVSLSIAHKDRQAVAIASSKYNVGIDIERIESRDQSFYNASFTEAELSMVPEEDRDTWATRIWCAKEAYAKATGRGLEGRPKAFELEKDDGVLVHINGHKVYTHQHGAFIVAYTHINRGTDG